ncbi:MAG: aminotransferase class IV, partial [Bacteroidia bacterium]|nr:aminotransferase class IV [Bacteroidia bacterium]
NIFFAFGDTIVTPATDGTILKGITRRSCLQILENKGYKVEERELSIDEVMERGKKGELTEVFGSGTAAVIAMVKEVSYKGESVHLTPANYKVATMLKDTLNGIRSERIPDEFNWNVRVV